MIIYFLCHRIKEVLIIIDIRSDFMALFAKVIGSGLCSI